jgi:hypothetical protein
VPSQCTCVFHMTVRTNTVRFPNERHAIQLCNVDKYVFCEVGNAVLSVIYINLRPQMRHVTVTLLLGQTGFEAWIRDSERRWNLWVPRQTVGNCGE